MTDFENGIDRLYATFHDSEAFDESLNEMRALTGTVALHLLAFDRTTLQPIGGLTAGASDGHDVYVKRFARIDPRLRSFRNRNVFDAFDLNAIFADPKYDRSPVYHEFLADFDAQIGTGVIKRIDRTITLAFAGFRPSSFEYYDREEVARIECVARTVIRLLSMKHACGLGGEGDGERGCAVFMDGSGQVLDVTREAREELERSDAALKLSFGRLSARERKSDRSLRDAVDMVVAGKARIADDIVIRDPTGHPCCVATVQAAFGDAIHDRFRHGTRTIVRFRRIAPELEVSETLLRDLFDLTPTETEIARLLCHGVSVKGIASGRNVAISTVRWTIRNVMEKFDVTSQTELVAKITRAPGILK